jgi:hypothetical protein
MSVDAAPGDPFARPNTTNEALVTLSARVALVWAVGYLGWRTLFTLSGADAPASLVLLAAEALAVVVFAAYVRSARMTPMVVVASPDAPPPDAAAVVDASGSSVEELRTTLVSLRRVAGLERILVVDPGGSRRLRTIAERLDASVVEASVSFDEAVRSTGTSWVLLLRSGDLPMPDLVSVCAPRCSSPDVAVVQVGVEEAEPTSFDHEPDGHWSLETFEQQVARPSLAARGSIPWYGDGPALVRRSALRTIEHSDVGNVLDDSRRVGLELIRNGMTVTQLPLTLARVRGPRGLGERVVRRHQRTRIALRALRPRDLAGVDRSAQATHLLALAPLIAAVQRILLIIAAILILGLGQVPMNTTLIEVAVIAIPGYLIRWHSHRVLGRGRLGPLSILRSDLRSLGVDLVPFGRPPVWAARAALSVAVLALYMTVVVATVSIWRNSAGHLPAATAIAAFVLTSGFVAVATEVLLDAMARRHRRSDHRVGLGLITCRIEEHDGQLVDLSTGGAGVVLTEAPDGLTAGSVTTVSFRIPDAEGAWKNVSALVHVAHRSVDPHGGTRLGLTFEDPTDAPLDPVIEFLTIDRRLVALGRHESSAG